MRNLLMSAVMGAGLAISTVSGASAALITGASAPLVTSYAYAPTNPDLKATITYSNFVFAGNEVTMDVKVENTTATTPNIQARLVGFAFNTAPDATDADGNSSVYTVLSQKTFPGFNTVDVCTSSGSGNNCSGGAGGGLLPGGQDLFSMTVTFASNLTQFTMDGFAVRFQTGIGSFTFAGGPSGGPPVVPAPAAIAVFGVALAGLGLALRRRQDA